MPPRTNGQRFFLTYSQATTVDPDELADFLHGLAPNWVEGCQENHQDGNAHFHVIVCFHDRFQRPLDIFDFDGFHPNIKPIRNGTSDLIRVRHYIRKGDRSEEDQHDVKTHKKTPCEYDGEVFDRGEPPEYVIETGRLSWGDILAASTDIETFFQLVRKHRTADFVLRNNAIRDFAEHEFSKSSGYAPDHPADSFQIPPEVDDWRKEVFAEVSFCESHLRALEPPHGGPLYF
nr:Rep protein [egret CRESS-DNA virus]